MEVRASVTNMRISPQKVRLVADQIRGMKAEKANNVLAFSKLKAASIMKKVLHSALANAENNLGLDIDELTIKTVFVDQGPTFKRFRARARGRANQIIKRTSHITIIVADGEENK